MTALFWLNGSETFGYVILILGLSAMSCKLQKKYFLNVDK